MKEEIKKVVIAVPAYFNPLQRAKIEESAKLAEIEILEIINEPTAAALSYGLGTKENLTEMFREFYMEILYLFNYYR